MPWGMHRHRPETQMEPRLAVRIWGRTKSAINPSVNMQSVPVSSPLHLTQTPNTVIKKKLIPSVLDCVGCPCNGVGRVNHFADV